MLKNLCRFGELKLPTTLQFGGIYKRILCLSKFPVNRQNFTAIGSSFEADFLNLIILLHKIISTKPIVNSNK